MLEFAWDIKTSFIVSCENCNMFAFVLSPVKQTSSMHYNNCQRKSWKFMKFFKESIGIFFHTQETEMNGIFEAVVSCGFLE